MSDEKQMRRSEDRDRELNDRLDHLESENAGLRTQVTTLQGSLQIVNVEIGHLKEILEARLRVIDRGQELIVTQMGTLTSNVQTMAAEPEKTPLGRTLLEYCKENATRLEDHEKRQDELGRWQNQVDGAILLLKFFGAAGMISLGVTIFKLIKGTL